MYEDIRVSGHLVCKIDRQRWLLEVKTKSGCHIIDLAKYLSPKPVTPRQGEESPDTT